MSSPTVPISTSADTNSAGDDLQHFHYDIAMSCGGCSGAITRVLTKYPDVVRFEVSLETQSADVWARPNVTPNELTTKLVKTGKTIKSGTLNGEAISI